MPKMVRALLWRIPTKPALAVLVLLLLSPLLFAYWAQWRLSRFHSSLTVGTSEAEVLREAWALPVGILGFQGGMVDGQGGEGCPADRTFALDDVAPDPAALAGCSQLRVWVKTQAFARLLYLPVELHDGKVTSVGEWK
jgi:hypothetical protein